jgi:hypothetical protein
MIQLNFRVRNPWSDRFKNVFCKVFNTPFANKFIEVEVYKDSSFVAVAFGLTTRQSHAGLDVEVGLFGYCFHFNLYDSRHWNYDLKCWEIYK